MNITRINHMGLNSQAKADEMSDFYLGFLGLSNIERTGFAQKIKGFWAGKEDPLIHLIDETAAGDFAMPYGNHLAFYVSDIESAVAEVTAKTEQHLLIGEAQQRVIWFKDPAGNTVELQQDPEIKA